MRRAAVLILFVVTTVTALACSDAPARGLSPAAPTTVPLEAKGGTRTIPLRVTISNTDAQGNPSGITNDGLGDYVDGVQDVQAALDVAGTFAFNTFVGKRGSATRWVTYDFSQPVDPLNQFRPGQDRSQNFHFSTGGSSFSPWVPVQLLGASGYPATQCGYMGNSFAQNSSTGYRVSYHKAFEDTAGSPTAFAVFTRVSMTPAVWTVQPVGSCSPNSSVAALRSADGSILLGYYTIPFLFTLTAK